MSWLFFLLRTQRNKATSRNQNNIYTNTKEKSKSVNLHTTNHSDTVLRNVELSIFLWKHLCLNNTNIMTQHNENKKNEYSNGHCNI